MTTFVLVVNGVGILGMLSSLICGDKNGTHLREVS